jgi:hypothetical protein
MLKIFRKKVAASLLSIISGVTYADIDIKLNCQLSVTRTFQSGFVEQKVQKLIFDVYQDKNFLSIIPNNNDFISVSTNLSKSKIYVFNSSNENRWELLNNFTINLKNSNAEISIDRNTGDISYYANFQEGRLITEGTGTCSKIDTKVKKF